TKLDAAGELVYSRVVGGTGYDEAFAIAVDFQGNVFVTGRTSSTNFPVVNAWQTQPSSNGAVFVFKLEASGSALLYSPYLGGSLYEYGAAITVTPTGEAIIVGNTGSPDFPTTPRAFQTRSNAPSASGFVAKL